MKSPQKVDKFDTEVYNCIVLKYLTIKSLWSDIGNRKLTSRKITYIINSKKFDKITNK